MKKGIYSMQEEILGFQRMRVIITKIILSEEY